MTEHKFEFGQHVIEKETGNRGVVFRNSGTDGFYWICFEGLGAQKLSSESLIHYEKVNPVPTERERELLSAATYMWNMLGIVAAPQDLQQMQHYNRHAGTIARIRESLGGNE